MEAPYFSGEYPREICGGVLIFLYGMKWVIFENRSITTPSSVQPCDWGRLHMKSMAIDCHGEQGSSRGDRSPYLLWRWNLSRWQSGHAWMYSVMSVSIPGHQKFCLRISIVFSCPKCPATFLSYSDSRMVGMRSLGTQRRPR